MGRTLHQLKVLFLKNFLLQRRHPWVTAFECILPALLSGLLLIGRVEVEPIPVTNITTWKEFRLQLDSSSPNILPTMFKSCNSPILNEPLILAYSPNTKIVTDFMEDLKSILSSDNDTTYDVVKLGFISPGCLEIKGFNTSKDLDTYMIAGGNSSNVFYGIDFKNEEWFEGKALPKTLDYALRPVAAPRFERETTVSGRTGWLTNILFSRSRSKNGPRSKESKYGGNPFYYRELFLEMQHLIDYLFILKHKPTAIAEIRDFDLRFERFPYPPYTDDEFIAAISQQLPFIILLSFIVLGQQTAKNIAVEKESRLKEYMLMMGLTRTALWTSWFIHYFIMTLIPTILVTIVLCAPFSDYGAMLQYSSPTLTFVFLLLWGLSLVNLGFFISTWFSSASTTAASASILIFVFYIPYGFINQQLDTIPKFVIGLFSLLSPVNMAFGCSVIISFEARSEGIQWSTIAEPVSISNDNSMLRVMILMVIDTILYYILTRYMDLVRTGDWGISLPWYFCFTKSYWCPGESKVLETNQSKVSLMEHLPKDHKVGFRLDNVIKQFKVNGKNKKAVDGLSFTAIAEEITVLLGHNGAGKSTTMNMLTGMLSADAGDCYVGDVNVGKNVSRARKSLGLCPQHNILIKEMTVMEHFLFFAQLKGFTYQQAADEAISLVGEVQLREKRHEPASALSGGMKRKLSLGIALCGNSNHLILDEPSSGIDVLARRELWSILEGYRLKRTMLISTHYMDEAEALADRIVIIAKGELKCAGSTSFLKNNLGDGYHLTLSLNETAVPNKITEFIQSKTPEAILEQSIGAEIEYVLPFTAAPKFPGLFRALDELADDFGIQSYGASITTMDEIFMKVTNDPEDENVDNDISVDDDILKELSKTLKLLKGWPLRAQQFRGSFIKCFLHAVRNWKIIILQLLLPALMTALAVVQILSIPEIGAQPELNLSLAPYKTMNNLELKTPLVFTDTRFGAIVDDLLQPDSQPVNLPGTNLAEWIPETINAEQSSFDRNYILAFESQSDLSDNKKQLKTWFNAEGYHSSAAAIYYADQVVLKQILGVDYVIQTSNHPLPPNSTEALKKNINFLIQGSIISFNLVIGVMIMFASFTMLPVRERSSGVRILQKSSGATLWITWLAEYVWDILNCIPSFGIILVIFVAAQSVDGISEFIENSDVIAVLFILFTLAELPFTYCVSFLFSQPSSAISRTAIINVILAMATYVTIVILKTLDGTQETGDMLNNVFCIFPQFNFAMALFDIYLNANIVKQCTSSKIAEISCAVQNVTFVTDPWAVEPGGAGRYLLSLFFEIPFFFGLLAFIEWETTTRVCETFFKKVWKIMTCQKPTGRIHLDSVSDDPEDDEVSATKQLIQSDESLVKKKENTLVVNGLAKEYTTKDGVFTAVESVSFLTRRGECFGLLGPNGAGKTSTFKMLTGEHGITSGSAHIDRYNISTDRLTALRRFGYCPQFDALLDQLTGAETIRMYSRLRGIPEAKIEKLTSQILKLVGIEIHKDKYVRGYSGGTKRKLSVGISLVGFPPLLLMDEPSCGLDPGARRKLWNVILGAQRMGAAVLLTSHSMEECAALCNRLAIMVNGKFKCIGGQQYLKSKYGQGVVVDIQVGEAEVDLIIEKANKRIPGLVFRDKFRGSVSFNAARETSLAMIFEQLEEIKNDIPTMCYTVNQSTLEQIFISMTKTQKGAHI